MALFTSVKNDESNRKQLLDSPQQIVIEILDYNNGSETSGVECGTRLQDQ